MSALDMHCWPEELGVDRKRPSGRAAFQGASWRMGR
jgi:hypothetical protein